MHDEEELLELYARALACLRSQHESSAIWGTVERFGRRYLYCRNSSRHHQRNPILDNEGQRERGGH